MKGINLNALAIVGIVIGVVYIVKKLSEATEGVSRGLGGSGNLGEDVGSFVAGTGQSVRDLITAATTGNIPANPDSRNRDDLAVNYFASLHDLFVHPVDSFNTLTGR